MPAPSFFESLKTYVGFTDDASGALREVRGLVQPHFASIIDDFYATIEAHPGARAAITGGSDQIERLKTTLRQWLAEVFLGPHDEAYFERRARIGRVHVRISLPQAYMLTAMDRIRVRVMDVLRTALAGDAAALGRVSTAVHQILDIDLAIMLETYREDLVAKNRTAERLSTIGQFAAGIGHELRNPLGVVESSTFLLRQRLDQLGIEDSHLGRHLDKIAAEVQRSNKTINELLELARSRPPQRRTLPARALVSQAVGLANLPGTVEVRVNAPEDLSVNADPDQLARVLVNLFINASQAMNGAGHIEVTASREGHAVCFLVSDDGPGIPAQVGPRVFEALFTTKAKGSGLGLALCRRILEAHGGTIGLAPAARGATFLVTLPDQEAEAAAPPE